MAFIPRPQEIYRHFKGNLYQIVAIAEHSETGEQLVIYQALYGDFKIYARPLAMFTDRVDRIKYPDVKQEFRFALQGAESTRQKAESPRQKEESARQKTENDEKQHKTAAQAVSERKNAIEETPEELREESPEESRKEDGEEEPALDPMVIEFLDADSYEQRLNILAGLHHRITNEMITTMAIACDIEINDGDMEERYESLKSCLLTLEKYECNRLR